MSAGFHVDTLRATSVERNRACNVFAFLLRGGEDPPDWLVTVAELDEHSGDCLLGQHRYEVTLDPAIWESGGPAYLCDVHTARVRQIGGVISATTCPQCPASPGRDYVG